MPDLLTAWKNWEPTNILNQLLPEDAPVVERLRQQGRAVSFETWEGFHQSFDPWSEESPLHTSLVPIPFVGNLKKARVVMLLLNPGLSETDYFGERQVTGFRERLLENLKQTEGQNYPFLPLDPSLSWHSGNRYWQNKLGPIITNAAIRWGCTNGEARQRVSHRVAALELVPYHSCSYRLSGTVEAALASVKLARRYLLETLVPRAMSGEVLLVAMRKVNVWAIPPETLNVVSFSGGAARGAHLGVNNLDGPGMRMVRHLTESE